MSENSFLQTLRAYNALHDRDLPEGTRRVAAECLTFMGCPVHSVDPSLKAETWRMKPTLSDIMANATEAMISPEEAMALQSAAAEQHLRDRLRAAERTNAEMSGVIARMHKEKQAMAGALSDLKASINAISLASLVNKVSADEVRPLIEELMEYTLSRGTLAKCNAVLEKLK